MSTRKPLEILCGPDNKETPMIEWYWNKVRGTLCAEFPIPGRRKLDAVILPDGEDQEIKELSLDGRDVIVVQAKAKRLSMYLMGQTLFSPILIKRFHKPRSIRSVALCKENDPLLSSLLISVGKKIGVDIEVEEYPDAELSSMSESPGPRGNELIKQYRDQEGGTLLEKLRTPDGQRVHGVIVRGELTSEKESPGNDILKGQDVIVVYAKGKKDRPYRLRMYLMGQALFGAELVRQKFKPRSIRSVALCEKDDAILNPILKDIGRKVGIDMEVVAIPEDISLNKPTVQSDFRQPQGPNSGLNAILGQWPGDETDDEIAAELERLS